MVPRAARRSFYWNDSSIVSSRSEFVVADTRDARTLVSGSGALIQVAAGRTQLANGAFQGDEFVLRQRS
jgi:hypothetical protein